MSIYLNEDNIQFKQLMNESYKNKNKLHLAHDIILRSISIDFYQFILYIAFNEKLEDSDTSDILSKDCCWNIVFEICKKISLDNWDDSDPVSSFKSIKDKYFNNSAELLTMIQSIVDLPGILTRSHSLNPMSMP
jgi:hypothetical protein